MPRVQRLEAGHRFLADLSSVICYLSSPRRAVYSRSVCQKRIMVICRVCLFAGLLVFVSAGFSQEASPSPSVPTKPFVVDQTDAEKALEKEKSEKKITPTPTPD